MKQNSSFYYSSGNVAKALVYYQGVTDFYKSRIEKNKCDFWWNAYQWICKEGKERGKILWKKLDPSLY